MRSKYFNKAVPEFLVLIAYVDSECLDDPVHSHILSRTLTACYHTKYGNIDKGSFQTLGS